MAGYVNRWCLTSVMADEGAIARARVMPFERRRDGVEMRDVLWAQLQPQDGGDVVLLALYADGTTAPLAVYPAEQLERVKRLAGARSQQLHDNRRFIRPWRALTDDERRAAWVRQQLENDRIAGVHPHEVYGEDWADEHRFNGWT